MVENKPHIVRLGPTSSDLEDDFWVPAISQEGEIFDGLILLPRECEFEPNQESTIEIQNDGTMMVTVEQNTSTPGVRLVDWITLEEGEYELEVIGFASVENTFFPWIVEAKSNLRLAPLSHMTTIDEATIVPFYISKRMDVRIGVIAHNQQIGDRCYVRSLAISSSEKKILKSKGSFKSFTPDEFSSHQRTDLSIKENFMIYRM